MILNDRIGFWKQGTNGDDMNWLKLEIIKASVGGPVVECLVAFESKIILIGILGICILNALLQVKR